jgi:hypothetical protein
MEKKENTEFDPEKLAKELGLTDKQRAFADYYVFVAGLDGVKAVEMAGYAKNKCEGITDERQREYYINMSYMKTARDLLANKAIISYIRALRDNLDKQLIVDKLWVINKLKTLASGKTTERTQLEATKLLGQTMSLFVESQKLEIANDPSEIVKNAFKKRMMEENNNIIEFPEQEMG